MPHSSGSTNFPEHGQTGHASSIPTSSYTAMPMQSCLMRRSKWQKTIYPELWLPERAYGKENFYPATISTSDLNEAIVTERMKEFAAEGKLWWDFIRLGVVFKKAPYLVGRDNELNVLLWPVSQTSINKNPNITQTPGYDK